jgi:hypothetical protein
MAWRLDGRSGLAVLVNTASMSEGIEGSGPVPTSERALD